MNYKIAAVRHQNNNSVNCENPTMRRIITNNSMDGNVQQIHI